MTDNRKMNHEKFVKSVTDTWARVVAAISLLEPALAELEFDEGDARYDEFYGIKNRLLTVKKKLSPHRFTPPPWAKISTVKKIEKTTEQKEKRLNECGSKPRML